MSNIERKEYQETKVLRTRSPMRNTRSTQNLTEFDHNLDNLLEDLQNSVSRPGSSLGRTYNGIESNRSNSLNRISHMKASNPVTEYSSDDAYSYTSPDGSKSVKSYKKESYSYNTSGNVPIERNRVQNNINQLDSLLDDLQQVKKSGILTDDSGIDSGLLEGDKNDYFSKKMVQRELHYGETPPRPSSRSEAFERQERYEKTGSLGRESRSSEGIYGETRHVRQRTPSPIHSNTSTLSRQKKVNNVHEYPLKVFETTAPDIEPEVLASLDPTLRPPGNTKVTTTIKTYTYEIPGDTPTGATSDSESRTEKYLYSNDSQTTPSKSFVYNKAENVSKNSEIHYPPQQQDWTYKEAKLDKFSEKKEIVHPPEPQSWTYKEAKIDKFSEKKEVVQPPQQNWAYKEAKIDKFSETIQPYQKPSSPVGESTLVKETINTRNYQPGYQPEPFQPGRQKTEYFYNENVVTRNYQNGYPPQQEPTPPVQRKEIYIHHETHTNKQNGYPPQPQPEKIISYNRENIIENIDQRRPPPTTIEHKYISHTTDTYKSGYPKSPESEPLLRPQPFPTTESDGPPKKLDDLMATIGNEPPDSPLNAGFKAHEAEIIQQKKVDHLKQQAEEKPPKEKPKNLPATKNITGPPVYYPPGHEMFAKKEEASASMRAEGGMAQAGGKYAYEAESKSKSKSKSGAAIVPVCLPLCCGLPCVIL